MAVPDANIHPVATGAAAETVAKRQESQDLVFYAGWRVWIALEERNIPYQYKEVNPYKKEKHFLAINPKGLVPAVEYQGKAIYESLVLLEFLEEAYPDVKPSLLPADAYSRAIVRIWIDYISKSIIPSSMRLIQAQTPEAQNTALEEYVKALKGFTDKIQGPYFLGEHFSLVDVAIAPWIVRDFVQTEHRNFQRSLVGDKWVEYAKKIESRDSIKNTASEKLYYKPLFDRYLKDEAQSEGQRLLGKEGQSRKELVKCNRN